MYTTMGRTYSVKSSKVVGLGLLELLWETVLIPESHTMVQSLSKTVFSKTFCDDEQQSNSNKEPNKKGTYGENPR